MPVTNLLKKIVDVPVFEWMRFSPISTSGNNSIGGLDGQTGERYLYMIDSANVNYRYDLYSDSWQQITPFPTVPSAPVKIRSTKSFGYSSHVISATSTTLKIGGVGQSTKRAVGMKVRIMSGLGAGQERTITAVSDPFIEDFGKETSGSSSQITDSTKKWRFNQWDGYSVRLYQAGTDGSAPNTQIRTILYNTQTALTVFDANHQPIDPLNNQAFNTFTPFAVPTTSTHFYIESVTLTVDSPWTVTPNGSSVFMIMSGGVWVGDQGARGSAWFYDPLGDKWIQKTGFGINASDWAAGPVDLSFTVIDESTGVLSSGTATSGTSKTLFASGATLDVDRYANHQVRIVSGTGIGQQRRIVAHGVTFMHVERNWDITPDSTSQYEIWPDTDKIYIFAANSHAQLIQHSINGDIWAGSHIFDYGVARNISATPYAGASYGAPHQGYAVSSIVRTTSGILSGAVNAAGSNYVVGDLVTCSTSGTNGTFFVTSVGAGGAVTGLQLAASGSGYANGSSNTTGGAGSGLTITLTVGTTALVTTATNHDFRDWGTDQVKIAGCATDTSFNAVFTVLGVGSATTFSIAAPSSTASPTAANSQSTTVLVDAEKNWATNEHVGKVLRVQSGGTKDPTLTTSFRITSNTATTITTDTTTAATNGTSRYCIIDVHPLGSAMASRVKNRESYGFATSASATTLVDSSKEWRINQWLNHKVRIVAGTGLGNESAITANNTTTLTVASWGVATPDSTSKYEIMDTYGNATSGSTNIVNDTAKNWITNQFVGKKLYIFGGAGRTQIGTISSNTATSLTVSSGISTLPTTNSVYAISEVSPKSNPISFWLYGLSNPGKKGRYIAFPQVGGTFCLDFYDISTNTWDVGEFTSVNGYSSSASGTMFAYDGGDYMYITLQNTGRINAFNLLNLEVNSAGTTPYAHNTSLVRAGMAVVTTDDGLKYLYIQRNSGQEMWRTLVFW